MRYMLYLKSWMIGHLTQTTIIFFRNIISLICFRIMLVDFNTFNLIPISLHEFTSWSTFEAMITNIPQTSKVKNFENLISILLRLKLSFYNCFGLKSGRKYVKKLFFTKIGGNLGHILYLKS
jgi:hypothetical protein